MSTLLVPLHRNATIFTPWAFKAFKTLSTTGQSENGDNQRFFCELLTSGTSGTSGTCYELYWIVNNYDLLNFSGSSARRLRRCHRCLLNLFPREIVVSTGTKRWCGWSYLRQCLGTVSRMICYDLFRPVWILRETTIKDPQEVPSR